MDACIMSLWSFSTRFAASKNPLYFWLLLVNHVPKLRKASHYSLRPLLCHNDSPEISNTALRPAEGSPQVFGVALRLRLRLSSLPNELPRRQGLSGSLVHHRIALMLQRGRPH